MTLDAAPLEMARHELKLSVPDLWLRCLGLGGLLGQVELGDALLGETSLTTIEYDVVAQALNDEYTGAGRNHPVPYADGS